MAAPRLRSPFPRRAHRPSAKQQEAITHNLNVAADGGDSNDRADVADAQGDGIVAEDSYTVTLRRGTAEALRRFLAALGFGLAGTFRLALWFRWLSRYATCWRRGSRSRSACSAAATISSIILVTV